MRGEDILIRRKQRRVNQGDLARKLGIHPMLIGCAENGTWEPAESEVERALEAIDELAGLTQKEKVTA